MSSSPKVFDQLFRLKAAGKMLVKLTSVVYFLAQLLRQFTFAKKLEIQTAKAHIGCSKKNINTKKLLVK